MIRTTYVDDLVKISIVGHPAVGKTTMLKLIAENPIDRKYLPTQGFDLKTVQFGPYKLKVWDFGGQKNYLKKYMKNYILGSDIVFIVTDSSPKNVLVSKQLIEHANEILENDCEIIVVANKQDLVKKDGRMDHKRVEDVLQVKTIGLTAIDPEERARLMSLIENELKQVLVRRGVNS
jgi:small GTP-binding protein